MMKVFVSFLLALGVSCSAFVPETDFEQFQTGNWQRSRVRSKNYPPPQKEDVTFVETSGGDLGAIHFRSDGMIQIPLLINRFFGDEEERKVQLEIGALPENTYLYMPAWDVDFYGGAGYCAPERDKVYFNDCELGLLHGNHNSWHMNLFSVPTKTINFPSAPGEVARNQIDVAVDTANSGPDYWCTAIDWVALIIPAPRPLLLIHGWMSSGHTWKKMQKRIRGMYGVPTCVINVGPHDSISENASRIGQTLAGGLKETWGVEQFNILAHSKGGLDARWYTNRTSNPQFSGDIHRVMQIATPNAGSRMASYLFDSSSLPWHEQMILCEVENWIGLATDGAYCLTPEYSVHMDRFCPPEDAAVPVQVVAGRVPDKHLNIFGVDIFPVAKRAYWHNDEAGIPMFWGDGVVSVASAHAKVSPQASSPLHGKGFDHLGIIAKRALDTVRQYRREITEQKRSKYSVARDYGRDTYRSGKAVRSQDDDPPPLEEEIEEEFPGWEPVQQGGAGILTTGLQKQHEFFIQAPQVLQFTFIGMQPGVRIVVQAPDGKSYDSANPQSGIKFAEIPEEDEEEVPMRSLLAGMASLELTTSKAGVCTVTISAGQLPKKTAYQVWLNEEKNAFALKCWLEKFTVPIGQEFKIFCRGKFQEENLDATRLSADLQVKFIGGGGVEAIATGGFRDDGLAPDETAGDGIFTAGYVCPKRGDFHFTACATLLTPSGAPVQGRAYAVGLGSSSTAVVLGCTKIEPVDLNGNGMYDELQVTCQIEINHPGKYFLRGRLRDENQRIITVVTSGILELNAGKQEVTLHFSGEEIFAKGVDGPYLISELQLFEWNEDNGVPTPFEEMREKVPTEPYSRFAFEHDPVLLTGEGVDFGIDNDGDGVFDLLHVELDLLLAHGLRGDYQWSGTLFDENQQTVAVAHARGVLEEAQDGVAAATLVFDFPGEEIAAAHRSGVYHIGGISLWGGVLPHAVFLPVEYSTAYYATRSFVKNLQVVEVTKDIRLEYGNWRVNPDDGSLLTTVTMSNISGKAGNPLELVFWLVLPKSEHARLARIDGKTPEGKEYLDVTAEVEKALQQTGNRDQRFDTGETVQFEVAVLSRDRSIPDPQLFSFWAAPPITQSPAAGGHVDDLEVLRAVERWHQNKLSDQELLDIIEKWQKTDETEGK